MKMLLTADVHIGRTPSRLPAGEGRNTSCADAWRALVELAVDEKVQALLVAGDLVDQENRFFEARAPLAWGLQRLREAKIELVLVAGNHDLRVLPELTATLQTGNVRILGEDGKWESLVLRDGTGREAIVWGWSYPYRAPAVDPLASFPSRRVTPGVPVIALLHSDVGSANSPYCGTSLTDYRGLPVDLWVVGHVHKPSLTPLEGRARILIPGSPQGLDPGPGETGAHGPWMLDLDARLSPPLHRPTARVRYENLSLTLPADIAPEEVSRRIWSGLQEHVDAWRSQQPAIEWVCLRLTITGECDIPAREIENRLRQPFEDILDIEGTPVFICDWVVATRPAVDLQALVADDGVMGKLAKIALGKLPAAEAAEFSDRLRDRLEQTLADPVFAGIDDEIRALLDDESEEMSRQTAWRLIRELT